MTALHPDNDASALPDIVAQMATIERAPLIESNGGHWLQIPVELRELIDCAAGCANKTRAAFVRDAMLDAAEGAILHKATQGLSDAELQACEDILDRPLSENAAYQRMMARKAPWEL